MISKGLDTNAKVDDLSNVFSANTASQGMLFHKANLKSLHVEITVPIVYFIYLWKEELILFL